MRRVKLLIIDNFHKYYPLQLPNAHHFLLQLILVITAMIAKNSTYQKQEKKNKLLWDLNSGILLQKFGSMYWVLFYQLSNVNMNGAS